MPDNTTKTIRNVTKEYPDMRIIIEFSTPFDVPVGGREKPKKALKIVSKWKDNRSVRRSRTTIKDLVLCNQFNLFCTFTFDPKKFKHRYDVDVAKMAMHRWLTGQRKKYGRFDYIIVAEHHKDGAIHFHALFAQYDGPLHDSGVKHDQRPVYNLTAWKYGFSTAKTIKQAAEDREKVATYLSKYITKETPMLFGKKRFWVNSGLKRPTKTHNNFNMFDDPLRYIVRHKL